MGSVKLEPMDSPLFRPSDLNYPVQVFISVMEHTAKKSGAFHSDTDMIAHAVSQLDPDEIHQDRAQELRELPTWSDFKAALTHDYEKILTLGQKVDLYRSLNRHANEDSFHYLFRVKYAAGLIRELVSCECEEASVDVGEWAKVLFVAGLDEIDQDTCRSEDNVDAMAKILSIPTLPMRYEDMMIDHNYCTEENNDWMEEQNDTNEDFEEKPLLSEEPEPMLSEQISERTELKKPDKEWNDLITEAIMNSESQAMTVEAICQYIKEAYPYYGDDTDKKYYMKLQVKFNLCESKLFCQVTNSDGLMWALKDEKEDLNPDTKEANTTSTYTLTGGVYSCNQCDVKMVSQRRMKTHVITHVFGEAASNVLKCDGCKFKTTNEKAFETHKANWCSPVKCDNCDFKTKTKSWMAKHVKWNHESRNNGKWACEHCPKVFHQNGHLHRHIERDHLGIKRFHCDYENCEYSCYDVKNLRAHTEMHTGQMTFRCEVCGRGFNRLTNFERHQQSHKSVKDRIVFGCLEPGCKSVYSQKVNLRLHMERKHKKEMTNFRTMTAEESGKKHYLKERLPRDLSWRWGEKSQLGIQSLISENKIKIQELSGKEILPGIDEKGVFDEMIAREKLVFLKENGLDTYKCSSCQKSFAPKCTGAAVDHVIKEHNLMFPGCKLYQCNAGQGGSCTFSTYQTTRIQRHMITKHSGRVVQYRCKECNRYFPKPHLLRSHVSKEHPDMEVMPSTELKCEECGHLSRTRQQYERHILGHKPLEERRDFACDRCDKKFAQSAHLNTHIRVVHLKIKQYRCTLCDTFFSNTGNLEEHIAIKHMGYKTSQEWRVAKKDASVKQTVKEHEAFEYIKHWKDPEKHQWSEPKY